MTCTVDPDKFPTKKSFRQALLAREDITITDPSVFEPRVFTTADMQPGQSEFVTNHPKRSWLAQLVKLQDGRILAK
jgi:hypothetical protein